MLASKMATLRIPDKLRPGVSLLRKMDRPTTDAIVTALRSAASARPRDLSAWLSQHVTGLAKSDYLKLAEAISGLYSRLDATDESVAEFATAVRDAAVRASAPDVPSEFELRLLEENLRRILDVERFATLVKAWSLQFENERDFCSARIVTDVRPVFSRDVSSGPAAMLLQHHLKLAYHEGSQDLKYFYVTLTDQDLAELRRILDRAEAKSRSLTAALTDVLTKSTTGRDHE